MLSKNMVFVKIKVLSTVYSIVYSIVYSLTIENY